MQVTTVTATLRYSAEAQGAWRSVEVGAEATLTNTDESWELAQAELYHKLGQQLKTLWHKGNGRDGEGIDASPGTQAPAQGLPVAHDQHAGQVPGPGQSAAGAPAATENWCAEQGVEFKQYNKNGSSGFSHKTADGTWHNRGN